MSVLSLSTRILSMALVLKNAHQQAHEAAAFRYLRELMDAPYAGYLLSDYDLRDVPPALCQEIRECPFHHLSRECQARVVEIVRGRQYNVGHRVDQVWQTWIDEGGETEEMAQWAMQVYNGDVTPDHLEELL